MFDEQVPQNPFLSLSMKEKFLLLLVIAGVVLIVVGVSLLWKDSNVTLQEPVFNAVQAAEQDPVATSIYVDVNGAINSPGIYKLNQGDRVAQAIQAAGGFHSKADVEYLAHEFNLAAEVKDGEKIYVFFEGEQPVLETTASAKTTNGNGVSINTATKEQLDSLEGIGEKRAEAIIAARPYISIQELVQKKVLTENQLAAIEKELQL